MKPPLQSVRVVLRGFRPTSAVVAVLFVSACAVGPDFEHPAPPKADSFAPKPMAETTASAPVVGGDAQRFVMGRDIPFAWWTQFESPKLNALVERALRANPTIAAAQAALRQAQEYTAAQRGFFYPTVSADYDFERQKLPGNVATTNAPGLQGNGQVIAPSAPAQPLFYNFQTAQLTVGYTPDVFGANRRQVESLQAQADSLRYEMEATYITLAGNVVAGAIQEASLHAQIDATQRFIEQNTKALEILRNQFRLGYVMRLDVAAQESALAQAREQLPPLQKQLELTHDLLRALLGEAPNADVDTAFEFSSLKLPTDLPVALPSQLVEQRPDVRAAEEQLHSASAQVGVAIAARLPQFTISGAAGGMASQTSWLFRSGGPFWNLIGNVTQPIFDGFTLQHRQRAAEQGLLQAQAQYRSAVITALQNVADTLHAVVSDADSLAACKDAEQAAKVMMEVTERQYKSGYVNYLVLLAAQEAYQQSVITLVQAQSNRYGDTMALFQALGGGWWNRQEVAEKGPAPASPVGTKAD